MFVALSISDAGVADRYEGKHTRAAETVGYRGVVHGAEEKLCPYTYNNGELRQCTGLRA